jgi:hypothetical protein
MEHEANDRELKKHALVESNKLLMFEKELRRQADQTEKIAYGTDFFPFQHGDTLEIHRNILNQLNAEDLKETIK